MRVVFALALMATAAALDQGLEFSEDLSKEGRINPAFPKVPRSSLGDAASQDEAEGGVFSALTSVFTSAKKKLSSATKKLKSFMFPSTSTALKKDDPGVLARCDNVLPGIGVPGKKPCKLGKYFTKKFPDKTCPDGIGWGGVWFWDMKQGGKCSKWKYGRGTLFCERETCVGGKTYTKKKKPHETFCDGGTTPYKTNPQVCHKHHVLHVNEMSRSAAVFIVKRSSCTKDGKCGVFKTGLCIDLLENVWSSPYNQASKQESIGLANMQQQRETFVEKAEAILKENNNVLPKKYQCSDKRNEFKFQKKGETEWRSLKWHTRLSHHLDATLARFALMNY